MNALTTAFECVPAFDFVPIRRPIKPCSICQERMGAYSIPKHSRCLSFKYSVKVSVFQSSILRVRQSVAGGSLRLVIRYLLPTLSSPFLRNHNERQAAPTLARRFGFRFHRTYLRYLITAFLCNSIYLRRILKPYVTFQSPPTISEY